MKQTLNMSCIVLAGGKSSRLGREKVIEKVGDKSLLQWVIDCLSTLDCEIIVVLGKDRDFPRFIDYPKLKTTIDIHPDRGPIGGIHAGLKKSESFYNIIVAADMPFLNIDLLSYMIELANGFDVVIPRLDNFVEPLHAIYTKDCLQQIENLLSRDISSLLQLFPLLKVKYLDSNNIDRFDPGHLSFLNVNTEADLVKARRLAADTSIYTHMLS